MHYYPKAISNIIIITNPIIKAYVPKRSSLKAGTNSSTTTKIIAPAANANKYGNIGSNINENINVITDAIGSTTPDKVPKTKASFLDFPFALCGREIAAPSGKFCTAIPTLSASADAIKLSKFPYKHPS